MFENITNLWNNAVAMMKSRTVWGIVLMLASVFKIHLPDDPGGVIDAGNQVYAILGAILAFIGRFDRKA